MIVKFTIPGFPHAKARHHTVALKRCKDCQRNTTSFQCPSCGRTDLVFLSNVKLADPATEKWESFISLCAVNAGIEKKTYTGPVKLSATFKFAIPVSRKKKLKEGQAHTQRPDLDNLEKSLLDGMLRVAWHDDSQVAELSTAKRWTHGEPGTDVEIEYLEEEVSTASRGANAPSSATESLFK